MPHAYLQPPLRPLNASLTVTLTAHRFTLPSITSSTFTLMKVQASLLNEFFYSFSSLLPSSFPYFQYPRLRNVYDCWGYYVLHHTNYGNNGRSYTFQLVLKTSHCPSSSSSTLKVLELFTSVPLLSAPAPP